jgi:hypothetical protein
MLVGIILILVPLGIKVASVINIIYPGLAYILISSLLVV